MCAAVVHGAPPPSPMQQQQQPQQQQPQQHNQQRAVHLVVLQHGLWGTAKNMAALAARLEAALVSRAPGEAFVVENCAANERRRTHDGIDACGDRLAEFIIATTADIRLGGRDVGKLSVVGYSLGGLMCRHAIGRLEAAGYFDTVSPMNYVSFASPHLGSFREPDGWLQRVFNAHVPLVASRSGTQLMLLDRQIPLPGAHAPRPPQLARHDESPPRHTQPQRAAAAGDGGGGGGGSAAVAAAGAGLAAAAAAAGPEAAAFNGAAGGEEAAQAASFSFAVVAGDGSGGAPIGGTNATSVPDAGPEAAGPHHNKQKRKHARGCRHKHQQQQQHQPSHPQQDALEGQLAPLLIAMCVRGTPFAAGLARFRARIAVANIKHDVSVPYCTAALTLVNPYAQKGVHPVPLADALKYPSVVRPSRPGDGPPDPRRGAVIGGGVVATLLLTPLVLPLLPAAYLAYLASTYAHNRKATRRAPDARWLLHATAPANTAGGGGVGGGGGGGRRASVGASVIARLSAVGQLLSGEVKGAAAAAADLVERRRSLGAERLSLAAAAAAARRGSGFGGFDGSGARSVGSYGGGGSFAGFGGGGALAKAASVAAVAVGAADFAAGRRPVGTGAFAQRRRVLDLRAGGGGGSDDGGGSSANDSGGGAHDTSGGGGGPSAAVISGGPFVATAASVGACWSLARPTLSLAPRDSGLLSLLPPPGQGAAPAAAMRTSVPALQRVSDGSSSSSNGNSSSSSSGGGSGPSPGPAKADLGHADSAGTPFASPLLASHSTGTGSRGEDASAAHGGGGGGGDGCPAQQQPCSAPVPQHHPHLPKYERPSISHGPGPSAARAAADACDCDGGDDGTAAAATEEPATPPEALLRLRSPRTSLSASPFAALASAPSMGSGSVAESPRVSSHGAGRDRPAWGCSDNDGSFVLGGDAPGDAAYQQQQQQHQTHAQHPGQRPSSRDERRLQRRQRALEDEDDAAALRRALDSVGERQRRALLAGTAPRPADEDGVLPSGGFREQQAWVAAALRRVGFEVVDADCGNVRSHAALVNRDGLFDRTARHDAVEYVASRLAL